MNRVKNFIGAMREKGVRTVKRAVPAFFTAYCYFSIYVPVYAAKATGTSVITSGFNSLYEIVAAIKKISEFKLDINDYLDLFAIWYRDVLLFKATNDANCLIFRDEVQAIKRVADRSSYEGIEKVITALDRAKARLTANVNLDLTMELLLLEIKENG